MQQPAKSISARTLTPWGRGVLPELVLLRRLKFQRAVRSLSVVMANVDPEDVLEVAWGKDEEPVQALRPDGSDPSLAEGIGTRCIHWSADHLEPFGRKHLIERTAELAVAVMDKKPERPCSFIEVESEIPRLLHDPSSLEVGRATGEMDAPCRELDEPQHVDSFEPFRR